MQKGAEAFRSIGEVAKLIGVAPHVLRYWETQFSHLKPMKRPDGRRYYRPEDVRLAAGLCEILRDEGLTIRGARKMLSRDRGESVRARGAERLRDLLGAELPGRTVNGGDGPAAALVSDENLSRNAEPEPALEEEFSDMAAPSPKSRHRHRRRATSADGSLPLFPDLDATATEGAWLARLAALSAQLRALPVGDPRAVGARPQLARQDRKSVV